MARTQNCFLERQKRRREELSATVKLHEHDEPLPRDISATQDGTRRLSLFSFFVEGPKCQAISLGVVAGTGIEDKYAEICGNVCKYTDIFGHTRSHAEI